MPKAKPGATRVAHAQMQRLGIDMPSAVLDALARSLDDGEHAPIATGVGSRDRYLVQLLRDDQSLMTVRITYDHTSRRIVDVALPKSHEAQGGRS